MFKQFITQAEGPQLYLISSLAIFLVFFIVVTVLLFYMRKPHLNYMSEMPLRDSNTEPSTQPDHEK